MAINKESKSTEKVVFVSYQDQLNSIDEQIKALSVKKKEIAKLAVKEINDAVVMPLHQLNAIAKIGYEKAKVQYGEKWVE